MPVGDPIERFLRSIKAGKIGRFTGGLGLYRIIEGLQEHITREGTPDNPNPIRPDERQTYRDRLNEIRRKGLDGDLLGAYVDLTRLAYRLYADIAGYPDDFKERLDDIVLRDKFFTGFTLFLDGLEFFPFYRRWNERLMKFRIVKWFNGLIGSDLESLDVAQMLYSGLRSGYLIKEPKSALSTLALHAGIEKVLTGETAPFFLDGVGYDIRCKRFQFERGYYGSRRVQERDYRTRYEAPESGMMGEAIALRRRTDRYARDWLRAV